MDTWSLFYLSCTGCLLLGAVVLHLVAYLEPKWAGAAADGLPGNPAPSWSDALCHAPLLDGVVAYFTLLPTLLGLLLAGWIGLGLAIAAQVSALLLWMVAHELMHYRRWGGPKIFRTLGRLVGHWQNHLALWTTLPAIFAFWLVRLYELLLYPVLVKTIHFPQYSDRDWINVSRHKFEGLVGYDLIWCLYCDWMTGVWSLGTEMLRNVESFWCPIRFYPDKKCENCKIDFPDLEGGWVATDASLKAVTQTLDENYSGVEANAWYGHPSRTSEVCGETDWVSPDTHPQQS